MSTRFNSDFPFAQLANDATSHLQFDAAATLNSVRIERRRKARNRRRILIGVPVAAVIAAGGIALQGILPSAIVPAAQAYAFGQNDAGPVLAELAGGLTVHYLPKDLGPDLIQTSYSPNQTSPVGAVVFETTCYAESPDAQVNICVSQDPGLTVETFLERNWFEGVEATVNDTKALVNAVTDDGAGGILFSPEPGIVVEIHVASEYSGELRSIVGGMGLQL